MDQLLRGEDDAGVAQHRARQQQRQPVRFLDQRIDRLVAVLLRGAVALDQPVEALLPGLGAIALAPQGCRQAVVRCGLGHVPKRDRQLHFAAAQLLQFGQVQVAEFLDMHRSAYASVLSVQRRRGARIPATETRYR